MKEWLKRNALTLVLIAFVGGGFYYITPHKISSNTESTELNAKNINDLQKQIRQNAIEIESIQGRYVSNDELGNFVTRPILEDLEKLMREIQASQNQRLQRIEDRIDYLIQQER